jgi:hypothetical protein
MDAEDFLGLSGSPFFFSFPSSTKIKWLVLVISSAMLRCGIRKETSLRKSKEGSAIRLGQFSLTKVSQFDGGCEA